MERKTSMSVRVTEWVDYDDIDPSLEDVGSIGGFFENGMRWKDYINEFGENLRPYYQAIRNSVLETNKRICGDQHQNHDDGVPKFSDGCVATFTMRGWGDLMAAIWSEEEDEDYSYMDFYMRTIQIGQ